MLFPSEVCSDFQRDMSPSSPILQYTWGLGGCCLCVLVSFNDSENSFLGKKKAQSTGNIMRWQWAVGLECQLPSDWIPGNNQSHDLQEPEGLRNHFSGKTCLAGSG